MAPTAYGGERLSIAQLVERSDAAVLVRVTLARSTVRVTLREVVWGRLPSNVSLAGLRPPCVPDRATLRDWIDRPAYFEASVPSWRAALARGRYDAVIFVRADSDAASAICETETLLAEHWTSHPRHAAWRAELASATANRPGAGR